MAAFSSKSEENDASFAWLTASRVLSHHLPCQHFCLLQVRLVFILLTATYNIGQIFHLWFRLASSTVCPSFKLQSGVNVAEPEGDMLNYASTYILTLIMANLLIYCIFYLAMKLISGERPTPWVKLS